MMTNAMTLNIIRRLQNTDVDSMVKEQSLMDDIGDHYHGLLQDLRRLLVSPERTLNNTKVCSLERAGFWVFRLNNRWCIRTKKGIITL